MSLARGKKARGRRSATERREIRAGYGFLMPNLIGFLIFTFLPVFVALVLSFTEWDLLRPIQWVGLSNYVRMFTNDPTFIRVLKNTVSFVAVTVPTRIALALLVAVALNQKLRGTTFFRTAFFMPVVSSSVAIALVWQWIFNADFGPLNNVLWILGVSNPPNWLTSTAWALPALMIVSIWQGLGMNMIIFLAGLQGIPIQLYEAARIDGATPWKCFWKITLPMLSPTTFLVLVMTTISSFQVFDLAVMMTEGGPANATNTIVYHIYRNAFQFFRMGYAAAIAWFLFVIIFAITLFQFRNQKNWVNYDI
ncbi:MAG: sugar ABC transporter permease [Limnochordia bacterium]|nr:sugar ABC transporter permease [Limnochordia bacterium]